MQTAHVFSSSPTSPTPAADATDQAARRPDPTAVSAAIARRSFATLATVSPAGRPHVAGVLYEQVGPDLVVSTLRTSRQARNVAAGGRIGVCIPIRRIPFGPPSTVQFQANAEVLDVDDPLIATAIADGHLASITGHGELDLPDSCFLRITVPTRVLTYGLGMSLWALIRNPLDAGGVAILRGALVNWATAAVVVAAVAAAVNAGAFFAFSNFVMPALAELPPRDGAAAMQSINRFAPNPVFVTAIIGAGAIAVPVVLAEWDSSATGEFRWLLVGVVLSLLSFVITLAANVPRNNALDTVDQAALADLWHDYLVTWTRWNTARTITSAASVAAFVLSARGR